MNKYALVTFLTLASCSNAPQEGHFIDSPQYVTTTIAGNDTAQTSAYQNSNLKSRENTSSVFSYEKCGSMYPTAETQFTVNDDSLRQASKPDSITKEKRKIYRRWVKGEIKRNLTIIAGQDSDSREISLPRAQASQK